MDSSHTRPELRMLSRTGESTRLETRAGIYPRPFTTALEAILSTEAQDTNEWPERCISRQRVESSSQPWSSKMDTLKEKLKLLKECGKKIAELDEDGKDLDFINIDSEDDDGKKSEQSEDEKEEEEMSYSNEQTTEIDEERSEKKTEKKKREEKDEGQTESGEKEIFKDIEKKKGEEKDEGQTESGEKEIFKEMEEKKEEKDEGQTESGEKEIYKESGGSNLSDMENMVTLKNMLENLVGQEITARCETGYIVSKEDLREMNEGLLEFSRENATIVEGLEKIEGRT
ncbi:hypothetical protein KQX54_018157 [Cotesia glomerata]|uniref:Uncharacterized protein n=1 Tax=Cotesia glomerata TaxID=32391 RepID=A0AAV7J7N7_COTGL|nr:hypothetical protein KQX54_018157 [Cotesia glomerata]